MADFYPRNEDEAEAMKTFRETGSPAGLNAIGLTVKVAKVLVGGGVVYEIVRNAPAIRAVVENIFTNGH